MKPGDRVLVVEQNPLITQAIELLPVKLDRASDGWAAIELLETEQYAAILIDGDLPRRSGLGVLNYLREEVGDDLRHVIVMSSDDDTLRSKLREKDLQVVNKDNAVDALTRVLTSE